MTTTGMRSTVVLRAAREAALAAMEWDRIAGPGLVADAGRKWPLVAVTGNGVG